MSNVDLRARQLLATYRRVTGPGLDDVARMRREIAHAIAIEHRAYEAAPAATAHVRSVRARRLSFAAVAAVASLVVIATLGQLTGHDVAPATRDPNSWAAVRTHASEAPRGYGYSAVDRIDPPPVSKTDESVAIAPSGPWSPWLDPPADDPPDPAPEGPSAPDGPELGASVPTSPPGKSPAPPWVPPQPTSQPTDGGTSPPRQAVGGGVSYPATPSRGQTSPRSPGGGSGSRPQTPKKNERRPDPPPADDCASIVDPDGDGDGTLTIHGCVENVYENLFVSDDALVQASEYEVLTCMMADQIQEPGFEYPCSANVPGCSIPGESSGLEDPVSPECEALRQCVADAADDECFVDLSVCISTGEVRCACEVQLEECLQLD